MMYKNDLKRGNDNGRMRNSGVRRGAAAPTPFEIMQMEAARNRSGQVIPHTNHMPPSFSERSNTPFEENIISDNRDFTDKSDEICCDDELCEKDTKTEGTEVIDKSSKIQNAPIGRDELLIGALLAFLLFSDGDNDIVLIGILIFLLI